MSEARIVVEAMADSTSTDTIRAGLQAYNRRFVERSEPEPFNVVARDDDGRIIGGCVCIARWYWLFVDKLWVDDAVRGEGLGSRLLAAAEAEARRRGCTKAHLDTVSFQARPFYEKLGWRVFGQLDDHPPGHVRYFLQKDLTEAP